MGETFKKITLYLALFRYEEMVYNNWALAAEQETAESLNRPLVVREAKTGMLKVNFGKETLAILMETKHLKKDFPDRNVPRKASEVFQRFSDFRNYNNSLEQMVALYNYLKSDTQKCEFALIADDVAKLDKNLHAAEHSLTWNSGDMWEYIEGLRTTALDLNTRVKKSQENILKIDKEINQWAEIPLFKRVVTKESEPEGLLDLDTREAKKTKRYGEIEQAVAKIKALLVENEMLFKIKEGGLRLFPRWRKYLQYIDYMISDGLLITIACSIGYLLDETDVNNDLQPLFAVSLELNEPDVIFRPSLDKAITNNFYDLMVSIVDDIFHMAKLVPRVALLEGTDNNYLGVVSGHEELGGLRKLFMSRVEMVIEQANADRLTYLNYSYLWTESRQEYMYYFLNFSRQITEDEIAQLEEDENSVKKVHPVLAQFKEMIDHYEAIHDGAMEKIERVKTFEKWFKADASPFKNVCVLKTIYLCTLLISAFRLF